MTIDTDQTPVFGIADLDTNALEQASGLLAAGHLVAVPTETVYGLAADALNDDAVAKIYKAKGRPSFNPLIAHVADLDMAQRFAEFDTMSLKLAEVFWPGPLTLVLPLKPNTGTAKAVTAGLDTIALRQPFGAMAELARKLDRPLAAPSANSSGKISPTRAHHVHDDLGNRVSLILENGPCRVGVESTIIRCDNDGAVLLRVGGITQEEIETVIGPVLKKSNDEKIEAPGMMLAHYAPSVPLRMNAERRESTEAFLGFGPQQGDLIPDLNLSVEADLDEAAHNLFAMIKKLDDMKPSSIAVQSIPEHGLGIAINDRLRRAAHGSISDG